jgi:hypothetical protein
MRVVPLRSPTNAVPWEGQLRPANHNPTPDWMNE